MPTTHEQSDFAHYKSLVFRSLQPTKSACSAAAEKCLSAVGQPLSSVSGRKRYNTLDFPKENRVPTGMLLAPIGNPEPRSYAPLDTPYIFLENGTQTVKMQFAPIPQKIQNRCTLHPCEDENYSGFHFCRNTIFPKKTCGKFCIICMILQRYHTGYNQCHATDD